MGMFDTFLVKDDVECQTKHLECTLEYFRLGDTVPNLGDMSTFYLIAGHGDDKNGIIVINNIYLAYCPPDEVKNVFEAYSTDSALALKTLSEIVNDRLNTELHSAKHALYSVGYIIRGFREWQQRDEDAINQKAIRILNRYWDKFELGDDVVGLIEDELRKYGDTK